MCVEERATIESFIESLTYTESRLVQSEHRIDGRNQVRTALLVVLSSYVAIGVFAEWGNETRAFAGNWIRYPWFDDCHTAVRSLVRLSRCYRNSMAKCSGPDYRIHAQVGSR